MSEIDNEYFDDDRVATVSDMRLLKRYVGQLSIMLLSSIFVCSGVVLSFSSSSKFSLVFLVWGYILLGVNHASRYDGTLRAIWKRLGIGGLAPSAPATENREIGERTSKSDEVSR